MSCNPTRYAAAFPDALPDMGCPSSGCQGYELTADLDFDLDGDGDVDADDYDTNNDGTTDANDAGHRFWNGGAGWVPFPWSHCGSGGGCFWYDEIFEGNGHTISNLFISRSSTSRVGLFGVIGDEVRNLGLVNVNITGGQSVGAIAGGGLTGARILRSYVTGRVAGGEQVGGLIANLGSSGRVEASWSSAMVTSTETSQFSSGAGGLVGYMNRGAVIADSYATGDVTGPDHVGGVLGRVAGSSVTNSYATGRVTATTGGGAAGGLVGTASTSTAHGQLLGHRDHRPVLQRPRHGPGPPPSCASPRRTPASTAAGTRASGTSGRRTTIRR